MRCWRKADILPVSWNADINNEVGSRSWHGEKFKTVSKEVSDELCLLMSDIKLKVSTGELDSKPGAGEVFNDSFAIDTGLSKQDIQSMADTWINVEDDPEIIDAIVDDELEDIENLAMIGDSEAECNNDLEDSEEPVASASIQKHSHQEAMQALAVIQSYVQSNDMKLETLHAVSKVTYDIQSHYMKKTKTTKSIVSYFGSKN